MPEQGAAENTQLTNLGPKNDIGVTAESQIRGVRAVTDAALVLLQIREGLQGGSSTRSRIPLCIVREALLKMDTLHKNFPIGF